LVVADNPGAARHAWPLSSGKTYIASRYCAAQDHKWSDAHFSSSMGRTDRMPRFWFHFPNPDRGALKALSRPSKRLRAQNENGGTLAAV